MPAKFGLAPRIEPVTGIDGVKVHDLLDQYGSLVGFYTAYLFYLLLDVNLAETSYSYIGFNYILTAIAIGGFYLIPSVWSYFWTILLTPLVAILTISLDPVFAVFNLRVYSLPFNIMVLLFLYVLKFRTTGKQRLREVAVQQFSPEKNLYYDHNSRQRFNPQYLFPFHLPFNGRWTVSQGHNGSYTHRGEWQHAWDFVIEDAGGKTFRNEGNFPQDYLCFGKDVIATVGNSGRSPYPHLHFQFQSTPFVGSKTLFYPFAGYLVYKDNKPHLATYDIPKEKEVISNIETNELLQKAFNFVPGQKLRFETNGGTSVKGLVWEVRTTPFNQSYLYCVETGSKAWFFPDDNQFYFTGFEGDKKSALYYFFLAAYRVYKGFYKEITVHDSYPLHLVYNQRQLLIQDFLAPFLIFRHAAFTLKYTHLDNPVMPSLVRMESSATTYTLRRSRGRTIRFSLEIDNKGISRFIISDRHKIIKLKCTE